LQLTLASALASERLKRLEIRYWRKEKYRQSIVLGINSQKLEKYKSINRNVDLGDLGSSKERVKFRNFREFATTKG
jgi:hypothetical protein